MATPRRIELGNGEKAALIALANIVILIVIFMTLRYGYKPKLGVPLPVLWLESGVIVVGLAVFPGTRRIIDDLVTTLFDSNDNAMSAESGEIYLGEVGAGTEPALGLYEAELEPEDSPDEVASAWTRPLPNVLSTAAVVAMALANFAAMGLLVQRTGGAVRSPYSQLLIALIVLGPFVMTGKWTTVIMTSVGFVYYAMVLMFSDDAAKVPAPNRWVVGSLTLLTALVSIGFVLAMRIRRDRALHGRQVP